MRPYLIALSLALCIIGLAAVAYQQHRLRSLRADRSAALASLTAPAAAEPSLNTDRPPRGDNGPELPPPEVLKLRNEITRLGNLKRQLAGVEDENRALQAQLQSANTNTIPLPEGYMLRKQARMAGFATPAQTVETLLWAIENADLPTVLQAMAPETAAHLQAQSQATGKAPEDIVREMRILPGLAITSTNQLDPSNVLLSVTILPGTPQTEMRLQLIDGQWKLRQF